MLKTELHPLLCNQSDTESELRIRKISTFQFFIYYREVCVRSQDDDLGDMGPVTHDIDIKIEYALSAAIGTSSNLKDIRAMIVTKNGEEVCSGNKNGTPLDFDHFHGGDLYENFETNGVTCGFRCKFNGFEDCSFTFGGFDMKFNKNECKRINYQDCVKQDEASDSLWNFLTGSLVGLDGPECSMNHNGVRCHKESL
ncbi:hypothetical protein BJ944DRAFT_288411 [Cunninghamella echinulata]|nr:hypothetical protein BJ944DRAFT_288411 [Cunninghamella echinulata]